ncbi:hypothetical protein ACFLSV_02025 [Bacteroidota bacterium]
MKEKTYELLVLAPVPVGHQVEINWYKKQVTGILTGKKWEEFPHTPIIKDLDSGVVYGTFDFFWDHGAAAAIDMEKPTALSVQVLPQLERQYAVKGKVTACRVATYDMGIGRSRLFKVQTSLTIESETAAD